MASVDNAVAKCLRVEEKLFVVKKQNEQLKETDGMVFLIYRWLFHCITLFLVLGWETRLKLIQEYRKSESEKKKKAATIEKLRYVCSAFPLIPCIINKSS